MECTCGPHEIPRAIGRYFTRELGAAPGPPRRDIALELVITLPKDTWVNEQETRRALDPGSGFAQLPWWFR